MYNCPDDIVYFIREGQYSDPENGLLFLESNLIRLSLYKQWYTTSREVAYFK